jgi:hypothetical protein
MRYQQNMIDYALKYSNDENTKEIALHLLAGKNVLGIKNKQHLLNIYNSTI